MLRTLRQPRYAALSLLMLLVAAICVAAGTWQIYRLAYKVTTNHDLRSNAKDRPAAVASLLPVVGHGTAKSDHVEYRTVTATGTYQSAGQALLRQQSVGGTNGYYVITPFRTAQATLLVARGFVAGLGANTAPPPLPAPPTGQLTITARVRTSSSANDKATVLPGHQIDSVNATKQAARLGTAVYDGYVELLHHQPGTAGLTTIPAPSLSNPAGGAVEPQHLAYIIQWYLFAALALAAPFAVARSETRRQDGPREVDEAAEQLPAEPAVRNEAEERAARLADRYGRPVR